MYTDLIVSNLSDILEKMEALIKNARSTARKHRDGQLLERERYIHDLATSQLNLPLHGDFKGLNFLRNFIDSPNYTSRMHNYFRSQLVNITLQPTAGQHIVPLERLIHEIKILKTFILDL